jgi:hypothetical protein
MEEMKYAMLTEVAGRWRADVIESFLESEGIDVELIQDSISQSSFPSAFTGVQIFVPKDQIDQARELLKEFDDLFENEEEDNDEKDTG